MNFNNRLKKFQNLMAGQVDMVFLPISADLQYLMGVPRDMPSFGAILHPGMWLEGAWICPDHEPIVTLPRMTAGFYGLNDLAADLRILGDHDDPVQLVKQVAIQLKLPPRPRVAVSDATRAETLIGIQKLYPEVRFSSATALLNPLRRVKSEAEIEIMREAGVITEKAFEAVLGQLKHGMTELDVINEVDLQLRKHGAFGPSFPTRMYNSGPNYQPVFGKREEKWHRPLDPPVALLFDFGAAHKGYCYDYGRTVAFGEPTRDFQYVFELLMASQAAGITALKVGNTTTQVDQAAREVIAKGGYGDAFRHRLGHGIGIDVHEAPFLTAGDDTPLEVGMTFTIEPSIAKLNHFGARVEDIVVVRDNGGERLTSGFQTLTVID
jgi:Xaa-Pro aminopeptidase